MLNIEEKTETPVELSHLIRLLDDEDEKVYSNIRDRFISYGEMSSDFLKNYTEDDNILLRNRANEIISAINIDKLEKEFQAISERKNILEEAVFLIAEFGYPGYNKQKYRDKLSAMASEIRQKLVSVDSDLRNIGAVSKLNAVNAYLFEQAGFTGNKDDYYDTDNSYINRVIDTKLGIPISLSAIYILIARRLGLPVFGVNLPGHFIVKYSDEKDEYFVDPFNQGIIVSKDEAAEFIKNIGMTDQELESIPYLKTVEDKDIVLRMLRNLSEIYKDRKDEIRVGQIDRLMLSLL